MYNQMMSMMGLQQVATPYRFIPPQAVNPLDPVQLMGVLAHNQTIQLAQADTGAMGVEERAEAARIQQETGVNIDPYARPSVNLQEQLPIEQQRVQTAKQQAAERAILMERMQHHSQNKPALIAPPIKAAPDTPTDTTQFLRGVRSWGESD